MRRTVCFSDILLCCFFWAIFSNAHCATFVVNDLGDARDAHVGDGQALTAGGVTTLRAAIGESNYASDPDEIQFDPTLFSTPQVISLGSVLQIKHTLTITGPGAGLVTVTGQDTCQVMECLSGTTLSMNGLTLAHGYSYYWCGGGLYAASGCSITISDCVFDSNKGECVGGALTVADNGTLSLLRCDFTNNVSLLDSAGAPGGALGCLAITGVVKDCVFSGNSSDSSGGAVEIEGQADVTFIGCTMTANSSVYEGGAVDVFGTNAYAVSTFVNCTIHGNDAGASGGGIYASDGSFALYNCTVTANQCGQTGGTYPGPGGGVCVNSSSGAATLANTIIAGNLGYESAGNDIWDSISSVSLGGNLVGTGDGWTSAREVGDQAGTNSAPLEPLLGPLTDNGGRTQTRLPLPGSPAINMGRNANVQNPPFDGPPYYDQRGADYLRILGAAVDIGAVEAEVPPDTTPPVITLLGETAMTWECGTAFVDPGATASDDTDGDISANIAVTGTVDVTSSGDYVLTYDVSDAAGNAAEPVTRTVTVQDTTPPIITLAGDAAVTMPCNTDYVELGATGSDACDTSLPDVSIDASAVNTDVAGTYSVTYTLTDAAGNVATPVTRTVTVEGPCAVTYHTADQDQNDLISLTELLRIIQFFNSGGFHCESGTEDGYAPGAAGDTSCAIHQSDYMPQDWKIELSELLRIIQFFNSGGYHACPDAVPATEDGYCVGPA